MLAGSTAERLLHGSPCPVGVAPLEWKAEDWSRAGKPAKIGVSYAESDEGEQALRSAHAFAKHVGAALRVITVVRENLRARLESEPRVLNAQVGKDVEDVEGEYLSERIDLLVCGSRGYGPLRGVLLGSVTRRVIAGTHSPVIVLPRGVKAALEALLETAPGAAAPA